MDRPTAIAAGLVLTLALVAGAVFWLRPTDEPAPAPVPEVADAAPRPAPVPVATPPSTPKVYHLEPPEQAEPPPPRDPVAADLDPDDTREFQRTAIRAANLAQSDCLEPWAAQEETRAEVVMDTVVQDGIVVDVALRSLVDLPPDVLDCIRDVAWQTEWPEVDGSGEVRFQHTLKAGM